MSCAKFLSVAALWLGLTTYAALARAAQPVSDYDLEPLLLRYGGEANQIISSDDNPPPEMPPPASKHTAAPKSDKTPDGLSPAAYSWSDGGESSLCDQKEPALLPPSAIARNASPAPKNSSDWPATSVRRDARPAMATSYTTYSSDGASDNSTYSQPAPMGSATRSVQMPRTSSSGAMNAWAGYGNHDAANQTSGADNSGHAMPEMIGPGNEACDGGECSDCMDDCQDCFNPCGCCGWFAGADYLLVRPDFSNAPAFVKITGTGPASITYTMIPQKFEYQSSVRAFFGYRTECGDEIRFTYWNFNEGGTETVTPPENMNTTYGGQFMTRANNFGDTLTNTVGLDMNVYDIDYVKCCCNPCGCKSCCCPVWTLSYSAGVRIADERRTDNTIQNLVTPTSEPTAGFITASFIGAGPRVGMEGRRFFRGNRWSLFARANLSLLLGEYDSEQTVLVTTPNTAITHLIDNHDRIVPVADIELGGDWQMTDRLRLSAGYLFQAWFDLGEFESVSVSGAGFITPISDPSILGFDGLFARVEYCF